MALARSGSARSRRSAAPKASASPSGPRRPVRSGSTASGMPEIPEATTRKPLAMASSMPVWSESLDVHPVGDHPRPLGWKAQGADAGDELRRAAGEELGAAEGEAGERPGPALFGQEDVAPMQADREGSGSPRPPSQGGHRH